MSEHFQLITKRGDHVHHVRGRHGLRGHHARHGRRDHRGRHDPRDPRDPRDHHGRHELSVKPNKATPIKEGAIIGSTIKRKT